MPPEREVSSELVIMLKQKRHSTASMRNDTGQVGVKNFTSSLLTSSGRSR